MKQELTDQEIDAIPWANTGSFPVNIRALARSVERIVTERASEAQTPRYSPSSIELVSDHQKACIELLQEGDHDAMIRARLALLRLFAAQDAEIAALKAANAELVAALKSITELENTESDEWDGVDRIIPEMCELARKAIAQAVQPS